MIKCEKCGNIISDTMVIKAVAVIQINYKEQLCNVKCRKCKNFIERIPLSQLIRTNQIVHDS
jgi:hypothetical protein